MLTTPAPPFRKQRKRPKGATPAPPPPAPGLAITNVAIGSNAFQLLVTFAGPFAWNGIDVPAAFMAFTSEGIMDSTIGVIDTGPDWIEIEFNNTVAAGAAWQVVGLMAGLTPAVAWPQAGTVSA